jgi:hypothetical protein
VISTNSSGVERQYEHGRMYFRLVGTTGEQKDTPLQCIFFVSLIPSTSFMDKVVERKIVKLPNIILKIPSTQLSSINGVFILPSTCFDPISGSSSGGIQI